MSGFVYIWRDRKHKRYYVGSHWGSPDDGYICSSVWMLNSYARRPEDFKRRIVSVKEDRKALHDEEYRWLSMIKDDEICKGANSRYYNLHRRTSHWSASERDRLSVAEKISKRLTGRKQSPEVVAKRVANNTGKRRSPDQLETMSLAQQEARDLHRANAKALWERRKEIGPDAYPWAKEVAKKRSQSSHSPEANRKRQETVAAKRAAGWTPPTRSDEQRERQRDGWTDERRRVHGERVRSRTTDEYRRSQSEKAKRSWTEERKARSGALTKAISEKKRADPSYFSEEAKARRSEIVRKSWAARKAKR